MEQRGFQPEGIKKREDTPLSRGCSCTPDPSFQQGERQGTSWGIHRAGPLEPQAGSGLGTPGLASSCRGHKTLLVLNHASSLHSFRESPCVGLAPEGCALEALMAQVSNEAKGVWVTANANKSHKAHRALPQWLLLCTSLCLPTPGLVTRGPGTGWTHQALPAATTPRHPCPPSSFQFHLLVPEWDVQS